MAVEYETTREDLRRLVALLKTDKRKRNIVKIILGMCVWIYISCGEIQGETSTLP